MAIPAAVRDLGILLARIGVGLVFVIRGWQKLVTVGVGDTAATFRQSGVPFPAVSAWYATIVELFGGIALIVGLAVHLVGALLVLDMAGAYLFVATHQAILPTTMGNQLVIAMGTASLLLAAVGAGRFSLDHLLAVHHHHRITARPVPG
jgi:putative oxidoreductase